MFDSPGVCGPDGSGAFQTVLAPVLDAVAILSATTFRFAGGPPVDVRSRMHAVNWGVPDQTDPVAAMARSIGDVLYDGCYAHRLGDARRSPATSLDADPAFARQLAAANGGRERWEPGWMIHQVAPNGQVFVRKAERERVAMPGSFISAVSPGMAPQPGTAVHLRVPVEALGVQPGYYFAFGETLDDLADQLSLVRFYFHCAAAAAAPLLAALIRPLNRFQVPFQMKAPSAPALYGRTDAAVLYVGVRFIPLVMRIIDGMRASVPLETPTPLFAKMLWPGIAAAVDPGNGESFGANRCRLTAEGIVDAWRDGIVDAAGRWEAVAARFRAAGFDATRPWLGNGAGELFRSPDGAADR